MLPSSSLLLTVPVIEALPVISFILSSIAFIAFSRVLGGQSGSSAIAACDSRKVCGPYPELARASRASTASKWRSSSLVANSECDSLLASVPCTGTMACALCAWNVSEPASVLPTSLVPTRLRLTLAIVILP